MTYAKNKSCYLINFGIIHKDCIMHRHTTGYYADTYMQVTDIKQGNGKRKGASGTVELE